MEIFWRLLFAHLLADFTFQTNHVAAWKRRNLSGLLFHVTTHPIISIALTWPYLTETWLKTPWFSLNGWACTAVIYLSHILEDQYRVWSVSRRGAPDNFLFFTWDQVIHIVVLLAVSPMAPPVIGNRWPIYGCLAIIVTHFATVLIYFIEKDLYNGKYPGPIGKYFGMAERFVVFACFFLPGAWWLLVVPVLAVQTLLRRRVAALSFSRITVWLGTLLAVISGIIGRFIYFHS